MNSVEMVSKYFLERTFKIYALLEILHDIMVMVEHL